MKLLKSNGASKPETHESFVSSRELAYGVVS